MGNIFYPKLKQLNFLKLITTIGPSGVRALPLAAGINVGGMAFFSLSFSLSLLFPAHCSISHKGLS
jgi:hypothetical protein